MKKQPMNWIEGMSIELKEKRRRERKINAFVWLIFIPGFSFLCWYGIYKLTVWIF